jgi:hypothetical protein
MDGVSLRSANSGIDCGFTPKSETSPLTFLKSEGILEITTLAALLSKQVEHKTELVRQFATNCPVATTGIIAGVHQARWN